MTKAEHLRLVSWRLKILRHAADENRTVAHTCRYFGISRKTCYKWARRFNCHGEAGLTDRPRAPARPSARRRITSRSCSTSLTKCGGELTRPHDDGGCTRHCISPSARGAAEESADYIEHARAEHRHGGTAGVDPTERHHQRGG